MAEGAERAASVKLSLDSGEYLVELKRVGDANAKAGDEGKKKFDAMGKGIDAAKKSLGGMFESAKQGIKTLATLGGAFTAAGAAKQAVELNARFRDLSFRASNASGELVKLASVQQDVERSAAKTTRTSEEMVGVFENLLGATGDLDFTRDMLDTIGETATGTGRDLGALTALADQLHTKFGVTADAMQDAFARVEEHAAKGGPTFDEYSQAASTLGDDLLAAGMKGQQGFDFLLGALLKTDDEMQDFGSQVGGIKKLLLNLGKGSELKAIAKDLKIDPKTLLNEKDVIARMMKILSFGKAGLATLKANFVGPEEQKALRILFTQPFEEARVAAEASGLKGKAAVDAALKVLEGQIEQFGEANLTAADIQKRAAEESQSPQANLRKALERLNQAFSQPEMMEAIDELSKALPELARIFARFVTFAAKNPLLAGALGIGGNVGMSFISAMGREIIAAHLKGGKGAADSIAGAFKAPGGGGTGGKVVAGAAIAGAAVAAYAVGKEAIDSNFQGEGDASDRLFSATFTQRKPRNARERDKQASELEASIAGSQDVGKGFLSTTLRGAARLGALMTGNGLMDGIERAKAVPDSRKVADEARAQARARLEELRNMRFGSTEVEHVRAEAPAMKLEPGIPKLIGVAVADALGGMTLKATLSTAAGAPARAGGYGGHGPRQQTPASPGGGI